MAVVIDFCRRPSVGESALRSGDEATWWGEWELPDETRRGDTGLLFAAGRRQCFIGVESIESGWKRMRSGPHAGDWYVESTWRLFRNPISAAAVEEATGFRAPRDCAVLDDLDGQRVEAFLRRPRSQEALAIEGIVTEVRRRSRSRNPRLRTEKLRHAGGVCEACDVNYSTYRGLDATRVLTVHHRHQLSAFDEPRTTSLDDLAVLCANSHMLIHANPKSALSVEELSSRLGSKRSDR